MKYRGYVAIVAAAAALSLPIDMATLASGATHTGRQLYHVAIGVDTGRALLVVNKFVPDRLVIHAGDSVQWSNAVGNEAQTVTFGPLENTPPLITSAQAGEINPDVAKPRGGSVVGDISSHVYSSGALVRGVQGLSTRYTFTFPMPGTYVYRSLFHPSALGEIDVVPAGKTASPGKVDSGPSLFDALSSTARAIDDGLSREMVGNTGGVAPGTADVAVGVGNENVSINVFAPATVVVKVGSTVTWQVPETSGDPHALVFRARPGAEQLGQERIYTSVSADGGLVINPDYRTATIASGTAVTTTILAGLPQSRGGSWSSGILYGSAVNAASRVPSSYSLTFQVPGTYAYDDPFHPRMDGAVSVLP